MAEDEFGDWEKVSKADFGMSVKTFKMKVPNGWVIMTCTSSGSYEGGVSLHQIFIRDPKSY